MANLLGGFAKGAATGYGMADDAQKKKRERDKAKIGAWDTKTTPAYKRGGKVKKPKAKAKRK